MKSDHSQDKKQVTTRHHRKLVRKLKRQGLPYALLSKSTSSSAQCPENLPAQKQTPPKSGNKQNEVSEIACAFFESCNSERCRSQGCWYHLMKQGGLT